jgi:hypothetical protein
MKSSDLEIEVVVHAETANSWFVSDDGDRKSAVWVPKSQTSIDGDMMTIPEWLAIDKGFV